MPLMSSQNTRPLTENIREVIKEELDAVNKNKNISDYKSNQVFVSHSFKEHDPKLANILKEELAKYDITAYLAEKEKRQATSSGDWRTALGIILLLGIVYAFLKDK